MAKTTLSHADEAPPCLRTKRNFSRHAGRTILTHSHKLCSPGLLRVYDRMPKKDKNFRSNSTK